MKSSSFVYAKTPSYKLQGLANDLLDRHLGAHGLVEVLDEIHMVRHSLALQEAD
jgi:hypothetical protein